MQINHIKADNFKFLIDFQPDPAKLTCLIALYSSGKPTIGDVKWHFFDTTKAETRLGWKSE